MRQVIFAAATACAALLASTSASAAISVCTSANCVSTDENVMVNAATNVTLVTGSTQNSNVGVSFTSTTDRLTGGANGQAVIDSATDGLLNNLTFMLDNATFTSAIFNLSGEPGNNNGIEATSVTFTYLTNLGVSASQTVNTNGQNFFGVSGTAGERLTGITFNATVPANSGFGALEQLRLGGVSRVTAAVPEPATWAMMLVGFGAMGASMRRRRSRGLLQVA